MTQRNLLVWGTCWFDEPITTIAKFLNETELVTRSLEVDTRFVVFDARHDRTTQERNQLVELSGVKLLTHNTNAYPNKNFGVAMITAHAINIGADNVTIVDSDWELKDLSFFVLGL